MTQLPVVHQMVITYEPATGRLAVDPIPGEAAIAFGMLSLAAIVVERKLLGDAQISTSPLLRV